MPNRKPCTERYQSASRALGRCKDDARKFAKRWASANPERAEYLHFRSRLKRSFNITPEEYGVMLGKQEGLCAICGSVLDRGKNTHVDHDHNSGKIRSLLCGLCNRGIGQFKDDPTLLRLATKYVEFHQQVG